MVVNLGASRESCRQGSQGHRSEGSGGHGGTFETPLRHGRARRRNARATALLRECAGRGRSLREARKMRLGHGSAVVTLDTYGHLWPDDDDLTRTVMDAALGTREYKLSTVEVV
jgi:hypothetical protein